MAIQTKTKIQLEAEAKTLQAKVTEQGETLSAQSEQIVQMQLTIKDLQTKVAMGEKEREVQANLLNEREREKAINPQNLHKKVKYSGHPMEIQEQILKNAN